MKYLLVFSVTFVLLDVCIAGWPWNSKPGNSLPSAPTSSWDPYCVPASNFAAGELKKQGIQIVSHVLTSCVVTRKEFYGLSMLMNLIDGRKSCSGITVWVRPYKEYPYVLSQAGRCV
jgi:hypothetical protein